MKSLVVLLILGITFGVQAQSIHPIQDSFSYSTDNNVYFKDVNNIFANFLGTWEYNGENKYLKITLTKHERVQEPMLASTLIQYWDRIGTKFRYKEKINNVWVTRYDTYISNQAYILFSSVKGSNILRFFYMEPQITGTCERQRHGDLTLTYSLNTSSMPQLQWIRENITLGYAPDDPCPDSSPRDASDFIIPANMLLTKVN